MEELHVTRAHWRKMRRHVSAAAPLEACGLLAGRDAEVQRVIEMRNALQSPVRFKLDPREQLRAFDQIEAEGMELLGIFHSHPAGPETLSATDVAESAYDVVHVVWSRPRRAWKARLFRIKDQVAVEVALRVLS